MNKIDYDSEMKVMLIVLAVCLIIIAIVIVLRWDSWMYQVNFYRDLYAK